MVKCFRKYTRIGLTYILPFADCDFNTQLDMLNVSSDQTDKENRWKTSRRLQNQS